MSDPAPLSPPPFAPPPKKTPAWPWVLLVIGAPLGLLLVFGLAVAGYMASGKPVPVTERETAMLVTVDDLAKHLSTAVEVKRSREKTTYERLFDGARELDYEYDDTDGESPMFISSTVNFEPRASDAKNSYLGAKIGLTAGFALEGVEIEQEEADHLLKWGDESKSVILKSGGNPFGNYFAARKGKTIVTLMISGAYFDDPDAFSRLVLPKLEAVAQAEP